MTTKEVFLSEKAYDDKGKPMTYPTACNELCIVPPIPTIKKVPEGGNAQKYGTVTITTQK